MRNNHLRLVVRSCGLLLAISLCWIPFGCATWSKHGVVLHSQKLRIAVMPVRVAVNIRRITSIRTLPKANQRPPNEAELIQCEMDRVAGEIGDVIQVGLADGYFFDAVPPQEVREALTSLSVQVNGQALTAAQIEGLGQILNAQAILVTKVAGYGKIKRKWLVYLIASGVVEGAVDGVLAAAVVNSPWVVAGVVAEEVLQEAVTWGGGVFLFNRVFTPVILETELVSTTDRKVIWSDTAFARMNRKALKKLPEAERKKKEVRLQVTAQRAVEHLLKDLNKTAFRNVE